MVLLRAAAKRRFFDGSATLDNDLIGYWPLSDDESDELVSDQSPNGRNFMANADTDTFSTTGKLTKALDLDEASGKWVDAYPLNSYIGNSKNFTFNFWVNVTTTYAADRAFIGNSTSFTTSGISLTWSIAYGWYTRAGNGTSSGVAAEVSSSPTAPSTGWHMITLTVSSSIGIIDYRNNANVYVDNVLVTTYRTSGGSSWLNDFAPSNTYLGKLDNTTIASDIMCELGGWSRVITATERAQLYGDGTPPTYRNTPKVGLFDGEYELQNDLRAWYQFTDDAANTDVVCYNDSSLDGTSSTNTNNIFTSVGLPSALSGAYDLSGGSESIDLPIEPVTGDLIEYNRAFSGSLWFYYAGAGSSRYLLAKSDAALYPGFYLYLNGSTDLRFLIRAAASGAHYYYATSSMPSVGWNHVLFGKDETSTYAGLGIFLNGADSLLTANDGSGGAWASTCASSNDMRIGNGYNATLAAYDSEVGPPAFWEKKPTWAMAHLLYAGGNGRDII